jgi:hypothetical protein
MLYKAIQNNVLFVSVMLIFIVAWLLQCHIFLNMDVSWLMEASRRMLSGGTYTKDFFENNPPWILYFYIPPVLFAKLFSMSIVVPARIYIFGLMIISLSLSYVLLQQIFRKEDVFFVKFLTILLAILFVVVPLHDFGQREHLFFVLSMPYFLLVTRRMQNAAISSYFASTVGMVAGAAFILKPYFLAPLCLVELGYALYKKHKLAWRRPEMIVMILMSFCYLLLIVFRHWDYLTQVLPVVAKWHNVGSKRPWTVLLSMPSIVYSLLSVMLCIATYHINRYRELTVVMLLALAGFLMAYLMQRVNYNYRMYPAYSMGVFLSGLCFCYYLTTESSNYIRDYVYLIDIFIFEFFIIFVDKFRIVAGIYPYALFFFIVIPLVMAGLDYRFCRDTVGVGGLLARQFRTALLSAAVFLFPFCFAVMSYDIYQQMRSSYQKLVTFFDQHAAHQSVYLFSTDIAFAFPLLDYTKGTTSASRFSGFWILLALIKQPYSPMTQVLSQQIMTTKNLLIDMVAEDLNLNKPKLVLVDTIEQKRGLFFDTPQGKQYFPFDYLTYFKQNQHFNQAWTNYHYLTTIYGDWHDPVYAWAYKLQLTHQQIPKDHEIESNKIYVYLRNDKKIEVAMKNDLDKVQRFELQSGKDGIDENQLASIKQSLIQPKASLSKASQSSVFSWLKKQEFVYLYYKFDVYERNT